MFATLSIHDLSVTRGALPILDHVELRVAPGHRIGLVGPNGVGKSTLLEVCAGRLEPDSGEVRLSPPSATLGWLTQEPDRSDELVRDVLHRRTGVAAAQTELDEAAAAVAGRCHGAAERYDLALQRWLALGAADLDARIGGVCAELGLSERLLDQPTSTLSGGEAARAGLAALLLSRFDVYLLDEPTNDLDLDGLAHLERWILGVDAAMLLVSHDRRFLDKVVTEIAELDESHHRLTVFGGGWQAYLTERERARDRAVERFEAYESQRRALARRVQRQREWAQQGKAKARRSMGDEPDRSIRAFKIDQTEQLAGRAAQTQRALDRLEVVEKPWESWELRLELLAASRSGDVVSRLAGAVVERGSFRLGPIDLLVGYGDRIALVGPNGSGKTTLIDLILGRATPTEGTAHLGTSVVVGEIEQVRAQLDEADDLLRAFTDAAGMTTGDARTLLAKFGLAGPHVLRPTDSLSPGERTRAALALLMAKGTNLLVLDEPTNHLDLPAIEQLEQALDAFPGTIVLVTHDRELLDRVRLTRTIRLEDGQQLGDGG